MLVADRVVTLGHGRHGARAVLVRGSRITWVGRDPAQAPPHASVVDLSGCTLTPAFVDAHVHMTPTGIALGGLDLADVHSGDQLLHAVRTYAQQHVGRVVWGHGLDTWDFVGELPSPEQLTRAAGGLATFLQRVDGHSGLVDRHTLAAAPLARATGVERDVDGDPTGLVLREGNQIVRRWSVGAMTASELARARETVVAHAVSRGIASVHEMNGPDQMGRSDFDAWIGDAWPLDVVGYWAGFDLSFVAERDLRQVGGDLLLDGSLGSHTAALARPYADDPSTSGHLEHDDEAVIELFEQACHAGLQVAVHAIGDEALRQVVRCWQAVEARLPEHVEGAVHRLRHRVEHAEVMAPDLLAPLAELGLLVSGQPTYETAWGGDDGMYRSRLGRERASWTNPFRELADLGVPLAFGSDASATTMEPWRTVLSAEHRQRQRHALDRLEALSASTLGGRHAARQDRFVGTVRAGMRADLAAWEGDPLAVEDPRGMPCALTTLKGRATFGHAPGLPSWEPPAQRVVGVPT